jgi:hypothetical protein
MHSALHFVSTRAETKGGFVREGKRRECGTAYRISSFSMSSIDPPLPKIWNPPPGLVNPCFRDSVVVKCENVR